MQSGVYAIVSPSGKQYIGSSKDFDIRWRQHKQLLASETHYNAALQNAYHKYGDKLVFKKLIICRKEDAVFYEQLCMDALNPKYNRRPTANSNLGHKFSEETRARMGASRKGKKQKRTLESQERTRTLLIGNTRSLGKKLNLSDTERDMRRTRIAEHNITRGLKHNISDAQISDITRLYLDDTSLKAISVIYKCNSETIKDILIDNGVTVRPRGISKYVKTRQIQNGN